MIEAGPKLASSDLRSLDLARALSYLAQMSDKVQVEYKSGYGWVSTNRHVFDIHLNVEENHWNPASTIFFFFFIVHMPNMSSESR